MKTALNHHIFWIFLVVFFTDLQAASLVIEAAKWESGDKILVVEGKTGSRNRVTIKNAANLNTLGRVRSEKSGDWFFKKEGLNTPPCKVTAVSDGQMVTADVKNACGSEDDNSTPGEPTGQADHVTLAVNDLGMHCADLDYQVFSILPPYNVLHAQVIKKGTTPNILDNEAVDVYYQATPFNFNTSEGQVSDQNSTSRNLDLYDTNGNPVASIYKSNFWQQFSGNDVIGGSAYNPLYHGLVDVSELPSIDGEGLGLPAPNVEQLYLGDGQLTAHQQKMPGTDNVPQKFEGYIRDFPFFTNFGFGYVAEDLKRHTAEGVPILPVTDSGWQYAYPLMKVYSVPANADANDPGNILASVRTTVPVASEADCQGCHADQDVCDFANKGLLCDGRALPVEVTNAEGVQVLVDYLDSLTEDNAGSIPGTTRLQKVINTAKINILRLHDKKHGTNLDETRQVVCATCHYSPALDLAQLGPNDLAGKEQTQHASMSRVMHQHHADTGEFPDMPPPVDASGNPRSPAVAKEILVETCYSCHPGKRSQCMRGAMTAANIVCQDCHGQMAQVGDDFSENLTDNQNGTEGLSTHLVGFKRVPWASEPGCQSCHTGDAVNNLAMSDNNVITAPDTIRLLQAYRKNDESAEPIKATNKRFAETRDTQGNDQLYRLGKGHGGVMCEGCHGSTHAIWPNPTPISTDNQNAIDVQGHAGTIVECQTCHTGSLGLTLKGPHGMHPVNDSNWTRNHKEIAEHNGGACKTCHGVNGEGTVLSKTAADRVGECKDEKGSLCSREGQKPTIDKGTLVSCTLCHGNYINE